MPTQLQVQPRHLRGVFFFALALLLTFQLLASSYQAVSAQSATQLSSNLNPSYQWEAVQQDRSLAQFRGEAIALPMDTDGRTLVVGRLWSQAAHVYDRTPSGSWVQVATLTAGGEPDSRGFGYAVAHDGDTIVVGAPSAYGRSTKGSVYIFSRNAGGENAWGRVAKIDVPDGQLYSEFGGTLALEADTLIVGATQSRVFGFNSGVVYEYTRDTEDPNSWTYTAQLKGSDTAAQDNFGAGLALDGDTLVIGAPQAEDYTDEPGVVYIFERQNGAWVQIAQHTAPDAQPDDGFGVHLALVDNMLLVGHPSKSEAFLFTRQVEGEVEWSHVVRIVPNTPIEDDSFGGGVAIDNGRLFVGATSTIVDYKTYRGAIYVFEPSNSPQEWSELTVATLSPTLHDVVFGQPMAAIEGEIFVLPSTFSQSPQSIYTFTLVRRPTPTPDTATTDEDQSVAISVLENDTSPAEAGTIVPSSLTITSKPAHGSATLDLANSIITYTPAKDFYGTDELTYRISTTMGTSNFAKVSITVESVNDAPLFSSTAVKSATVASPYSYTLKASDVDLNETLQFSAPTKPAWLSLSTDATGATILSGTPAAVDVGDQVVELLVTDLGGLSTSQQFTITVKANSPPVFRRQPILSVTEGQLYYYSISFLDPDPSQLVELQAENLPVWLSLTQDSNTSGLLTGTPETADVGEYPIVLTLTDPGGLETTQSYTLTVKPDRPGSPTNLVALPSSPSSIRLTWRDASSNELGFYVERRLPAGAWVRIATLGPNTTTYEDTSLGCGVAYEYQVLAYHDRWESLPSNLNQAMPEQSALAQFVYQSGSIPITTSQIGATASLFVPASGRVLDLDVQINLDHTNVSDLNIRLVAPDGKEVVLSAANGGAGRNYRNTLFNDEAATSIIGAAAPFTGSYQPQSPLAAFDGTEINGTWKLVVRNRSGGFPGTFHGFSITATLPDGCPGIPATSTPSPTITNTPTSTITSTPTRTSTPTVRPITTFYVNVAAQGAGTGGSWADAYIDLQSALQVARAGDTIWVATGTYRPTSGTDILARFQIPSGVSIYGGFAGNETTLEQRNWQANATILSGDIGVIGLVDDNLVTVVSLLNASQSTLIDGFTVSDARYGISIDGGSPTLTNLLIQNNRTDGGNGAGLSMRSSQPYISHSVFSHNSAAYGGAIYADGGFVTIEDVDFIENSAQTRGGAIYLFYAQAQLNNTIFERNSAIATNGDGGAIHAIMSPLMVTNSSFIGNSAAKHGGAIYQQSSAAQLEHVLFEHNTANGWGGAIVFYQASHTIHDGRFFANSATGSDGRGGAIYNSSSATLAIDGADFGGNHATSQGGAIVNVATLHLYNTVLVGNSSELGSAGALYSLGTQSIRNSTIAWNQAATDGGAILQRSAKAEIFNSIIWGNSAGQSGAQIKIETTSTADVRYSLVEGGWAGEGNSSTAPTFVDAIGPDNQYGTLDDNLRLSPLSAGIDAGNSNLIPITLIDDRDGNLRKVDDPAVADTGVGVPAVDLGAYEYFSSIAPTRTPIPTATLTPTRTSTPTRTATPIPPLAMVEQVNFISTTAEERVLTENVVVPLSMRGLSVRFNKNITHYQSSAILLFGEGSTPGIQTVACDAISSEDQLYVQSRALTYQNATLTIRKDFLLPEAMPDGQYRIVVCDTVTGSIPLLDGNRDGVAGGDFVLNFTIDTLTPTLTPTYTSTATATPPLSQDELVVFSAYHDNNYDIYVMNADGSNQQRLTDSPAQDQYPAWSPDGSRIAFFSLRTGAWQIYVMNADGSEQRQVTFNTRISEYDRNDLVWHPNGNELIYLLESTGVNRLSLSANAAPQQISSDTEFLTVDISPDGNTLALIRLDDLPGRLYTMSIQGGPRTRIAPDQYQYDHYKNVKWSPDGTRFVYEYYNQNPFDPESIIFVMNADGSGLQRLTTTRTGVSNPAWSPDGEQIMYRTADGLFVMDADGANKRQITDASHSGSDLDWWGRSTTVPATATPTTTATSTTTATPTSTVPAPTASVAVSATPTSTVPAPTATSTVPAPTASVAVSVTPTSTVPAPTATAEANLALNAPGGQAGSSFILSGSGLSPQTTFTLVINDVAVGEVTTNAQGAFQVVLQTDPQASDGTYVVSVQQTQNLSQQMPESVSYLLEAGLPKQESNLELPTIKVPTGISPQEFSYTTWLPLVIR